nr:nucleotidyltransferase domain-containing protein [Desulfobulbaceae bacterium]
MNHDIIREICDRQPVIIAAYLFGSRAKGDFRPESDIDLAVLLDHNSKSSFDLLSFINEVERETRLRADVVILNNAGEVLKYQVRKYGQLLYDRIPNIRKKFEIGSRKYFEDFLYLHKKYSEKVLYKR